MAADDGGERGGQVGQRIDSIEFAGLNERGDGRPVLGSSVVPCKQRVFPVKGYWPDGSFNGVVVDLDATICQEDTVAVPIFGDIGQSLAERGLRRNAGTVGSSRKDLRAFPEAAKDDLGA